MPATERALCGWGLRWGGPGLEGGGWGTEAALSEMGLRVPSGWGRTFGLGGAFAAVGAGGLAAEGGGPDPGGLGRGDAGAGWGPSVGLGSEPVVED